MRKNGMRRRGGYAWNQGRKNASARSQRERRGFPCMVESGMRRHGGGETLCNALQGPSEPPPRSVRGNACKGAQRAEEADFAAEERSCRKNIRSIRASGYSQSFRRPSGARTVRPSRGTICACFLLRISKRRSSTACAMKASPLQSDCRIAAFPCCSTKRAAPCTATTSCGAVRSRRKTLQSASPRSVRRLHTRGNSRKKRGRYASSFSFWHKM